MSGIAVTQPAGEDDTGRLNAISALAPFAAALLRVVAPADLGPYVQLVWLPSLIPIFLLTRNRGWDGMLAALGLTLAVIVGAEMWIAHVRGVSFDAPLVAVVAATLVSVGLGSAANVHWYRNRMALLAAESIPEPEPPPQMIEGIPGPETLSYLLTRMVAGARRDPPLSIVLAEVDHLDDYGHFYGEDTAAHAIRVVTEALGKHTREMNVFGQLAPNRFLVFLQKETPAGAYRFVERFRRELGVYEAPWGGRIRICAGIAAIVAGQPEVDDLLTDAEQALAAAHDLGGSCAVVHWKMDPEQIGIPGMLILGPDGKVREFRADV